MPKTKNTTKIKYLFLFDHDGTLCNSNEYSYDSIKEAFHTALRNFNPGSENGINWDKAFSDTKGTTERNLIRYLSYTNGIPYERHEILEQNFYLLRAQWYENMKRLKEYVWDTYYPDTLELLIKMVS